MAITHLIAASFLAFFAACGTSATVTAPIVSQPTPTAESKAAYVGQLKALGVDRYLGIAPKSTATDGLWQTYHYDVTAGAACIDGSDYIVSFRPSPNGSRDVALYLEGGGACWSELTCFGVPFAKRTADVPGSSRGMFVADDERNPTRDWNIVFASYCDGSVFSGDNTVRYGERTAYHWGLRNLSAAVTVLLERIPDPGRLLVTGSSAGGFGTFMAMGLVRAAYPGTYLYLLNDSGPGLENPALLPTMGESIRKQWQFEQFLPPDCEACDDQLIGLIPYALARDPDMHAGLFSYLNDSVIGTVFLQFYADYPDVLWQTTDPIHANFPDRFRRYFVEGFEHTILQDALFYGGWPQPQPFYQWFDGFLRRDLEVWQDRR